jgi:hypothetical protein
MSGFSEADIDLEKLFLPAWAQEKPAKNPYEKFTGEESEEPRRGKSRGRFQENRGERRPRGPGGPGGPVGSKKSGERKDFRGGGRRDDRHGERRNDQRDAPRYEAPAPLPDVTVTFLPDEKGVEQIARQIRMTGRAYPLFQIALLVLQKPERYGVRLTVKKKPDGAAIQPLFLCALDDTPWLSEDEAVAHVLKNHFATFYQAERTPTEPPKGTYTFVAQCGMSGAILGPPNYHDYQNQLHKLHTERFSKMPFDVFKARVRIVRDEAVVKKWIDEQSFKTEYVCLNVPEPLKLPTMEKVEEHFRTTHKEAIIKPVDTLVTDGVKSRNLRSRELQRLVRTEWENQRHFPLQVSTLLSRQFASHGLQFFKRNKTAVHVSVARPQFLDLETTPVSETIRRIVDFINGHPRSNRRKLMETLAPAPAAPAHAPTPAVPVETPAPAADAPAPAAEAAKPEAPKADAPTPEQTALIADLHWLIHQGHVLEFADGQLETAKKPLPKPPKPEKKPASEAAPASDAKTAQEPVQEKPAEEIPVEETPVSPSEEMPPQATIEPMPMEPLPATVPPAETPSPT